jgi:hypothetical protein
MRNGLREMLARFETLARSWMALWRRRDAAVKTKHDGESGRSADARARFWAEFREGQREAELERSRAR